MNTPSTKLIVNPGIYRPGGFALTIASNFGGLTIKATRKTVDMIPMAVNRAFHVPIATPFILLIRK
jgi:hypothetical protein